MMNRSIRTIARRSRLLLVGAMIAGLAACSATSAGTGSQSGSTANKTPVSVSSVEAKATTPATAADAQLAKDGYTALHLDLFGKGDIGISTSSTYRYEAVYVGKDAEVIKTAVDEVNKDPQPNVHITAVGNLIVIQAKHVSDVKTAAEQFAKKEL